MVYTYHEYADMMLCYGRADGNAAEARRIYQERYPERHIPDARTFTRLDQRIRDSGTVKGIKSGGYDQRNNNTEERILRHIEDNPSVSTRQIAAQEGVSQNTVWRILKDQQLHPYHFQKVQQLEAGDYERRYNFCNELQKMRQDPDFSKKILFTDEANFDRCGRMNIHNEHVWSEENTHAIRETNAQRQFSTSVWAGILGDRIIGPVIMPRRLTGEAYLHFLQHQLPELLEDVALVIRRDMWFLHDGAPPHYTAMVREYLNNTFRNKWIGRGGPIAWPARSPDMNPLDFFFWGHMKNLVYSTPLRNLQELEQRIIFTGGLIGNMDDFGEVRRNFQRRMELCLQNNGGHIEQLL